jgi:DNA modification methylase
MEQIFLFLDIDGVICTKIDSSSEFLGTYQEIDLFGTSPPLAKSFLQAVDRSKHIRPFWMSSGWQEHSIVWNFWAKTAPWTAGYPISCSNVQSIINKYGRQLSLDDMYDSKTIAVLHHSENANKIVWIEDGFEQSAIDWAEIDSRVTLIDTIHPSNPSLLGIQTWNIDVIFQSLGIGLQKE